VTLAQDPQVVGPMGPSTPGAPADLNEQSRARFVLIAGLGLGRPTMLPVVGVGVRVGFFQNRFEIQGRVDLALDWDPFSSTQYSFMNAMGQLQQGVYSPHRLGPSLGVDGTFRVRPISNRSIWYAGLGIMGRLGFVFPAAPPGGGPAQPGQFTYAVGLAIETGFLLGARSQWDLSFRFLFGLGALSGVVTLGYAF
jgi:hypothetical protein